MYVIFFAFPKSQRTVRQLYVHAVEADDRDAAWRLLCSTDRTRISREEFDRELTEALAPLGGKIAEVHPTRGAYEWTGVNGEQVRLFPPASKGDHPCIHLGANPLGV